MRLPQLVITLPLLLCASQLTGAFSVARADTMTAAEATALLAKSQTIDGKCNILAPDQAQQLKDMVARAEINLAEKSGVALTRKTISAGRAAGRSAACDVMARKLVNDVLVAAEVAMSQPVAKAVSLDTPRPKQFTNDQNAVTAEQEDIAFAAAEPEPVESAKKPKMVKLPKPTKPVAPAKGLRSYAFVAEKYYVALRCGTMSTAGIQRLYKNVLFNHHQALAANRPADVRAMLRSVEARAGAKTCS